MGKVIYITGTNTGVGKTVLTALLVRYLRRLGVGALAVKPFCSGGRQDARIIRSAQDNGPTLDAINPWHFRAPLTPLLAAQQQNRRIDLREVLGFLRSASRRCDVLLIEGAGGLLSPLGEGFNNRDLIVGLRASPIIVAVNELGVVNQVLLTANALPKGLLNRASMVIMNPRQSDQSTKTNAALIERLLSRRVIKCPWLRQWPSLDRCLQSKPVATVLECVSTGLL